MFYGRPVIRRQYVSLPTKALMWLVFTASMLFIGFVGGLIIGIYEPDEIAPMIFGLALPAHESTTYDETQYASVPRLDEVNFIKTSTGNIRTSVIWEPRDTYENELSCMALNIYFEARDESRMGQLAVGLVTINRVLSNKYPNTVCEVVWQKRKNPKTGKWVAQFSWTLDGKHDRPYKDEKWEEIQYLAHALLAERSLFNIKDFTQGSTHYHADYVNPWWNKAFTPTLKVDTHLLYRDEDATPFVQTVAITSDLDI